MIQLIGFFIRSMAKSERHCIPRRFTVCAGDVLALLVAIGIYLTPSSLTAGQSKAKTSDIVKSSDNFFSVPLNVLEDRDYKERWVQACFSELRGPRRLTWAEIALAVDLSKQYISQVKDGDPPSDMLIEGLCWVFKFDPPAPGGAKPVVDKIKSPTSSADPVPYDELERALTGIITKQNEVIDRLIARVDTQGTAINLMADALLKQGSKLDAVFPLLREIADRVAELQQHPTD